MSTIDRVVMLKGFLDALLTFDEIKPSMVYEATLILGRIQEEFISQDEKILSKDDEDIDSGDNDDESWKDDYSCYDEYNGAYGYDDKTINEVFDGDPENYWNID